MKRGPPRSIGVVESMIVTYWVYWVVLLMGCEKTFTTRTRETNLSFPLVAGVSTRVGIQQ